MSNGDLKKLEIDGMAKTKESLQPGIGKLEIAGQMDLGTAK